MTKILILIIEDENEIRFHLEDQLRNENYPVLSVGNGKQALQILMTFPVLPHFIILDADMPVMNGFNFRNEQSALSMISHIPVIFMSDKDGDKQIADSMSMLFLKKPVYLPDLLSLLRT